MLEKTDILTKLTSLATCENSVKAIKASIKLGFMTCDQKTCMSGDMGM